LSYSVTIAKQTRRTCINPVLGHSKSCANNVDDKTFQAGSSLPGIVFTAINWFSGSY